MVFEAISGKTFDINRPMENREVEEFNKADFVGVSYINLERGDEGHRLAVIHFKGQHRVLQSNDLGNTPNKVFTLEQYLSEGDQHLVSGHTPLLHEWMTAEQYSEWIEAIRGCRGQPGKAGDLTGVRVDANEVYVYSACHVI